MTEQWCVSNVECLVCDHTWVAAHPLGADELDCPRCGGTETVRSETEYTGETE